MIEGVRVCERHPGSIPFTRPVIYLKERIVMVHIKRPLFKIIKQGPFSMEIELLLFLFLFASLYFRFKLCNRFG